MARRLAAPPSFTGGLRASLRVNALYAELLIISISGCARGAGRCRCSRRALPPTHSCIAAGLICPVAICMRILASAVSERTYPERYEARLSSRGRRVRSLWVTTAHRGSMATRPQVRARGPDCAPFGIYCFSCALTFLCVCLVLVFASLCLCPALTASPWSVRVVRPARPRGSGSLLSVARGCYSAGLGLAGSRPSS